MKKLLYILLSFISIQATAQIEQPRIKFNEGIKDIGFISQELNKVEKNINEFEYINLTKHDKKLDRWFAQILI